MTGTEGLAPAEGQGPPDAAGTAGRTGAGAVAATATGLNPAPAPARQFLAAVEAACADLPAVDRARLLGGLEEHLAELAADGVDLVTELGDPVAYARELRSAAGLPATTAAGPAGSVAGGTGGPVTLALPLGPATTALPLGGPPAGFPTGTTGSTGPSTGPSTGKVLLVVGAVLAGTAVLVTAAVVVGGALLFGASTVSTVSTATSAPATDVVIAVPDVVGMTADEARAALEQTGLRTGSLRISSTPKPAGSGGNVVVAQDPAAGSPVVPGATVDLTITTG